MTAANIPEEDRWRWPEAEAWQRHAAVSSPGDAENSNECFPQSCTRPQPPDSSGVLTPEPPSTSQGPPLLHPFSSRVPVTRQRSLAQTCQPQTALSITLFRGLPPPPSQGQQRPGCGLSEGLSLTDPWWGPEEGAWRTPDLGAARAQTRGAIRIGEVIRLSPLEFEWEHNGQSASRGQNKVMKTPRQEQSP